MSYPLRTGADTVRFSGAARPSLVRALARRDPQIAGGIEPIAGLCNRCRKVLEDGVWENLRYALSNGLHVVDIPSGCCISTACPRRMFVLRMLERCVEKYWEVDPYPSP